ncbi:MAG: DNA-binding protein [Spartobacteria bacterium]|nr:DNA-binding protein [Spartobacteria bacterium]
MRYSEARQGRIFIVRLEDGEILHEVVEAFARDHGIRAATLIAVGGADRGSRLVVGPEDGRAATIVPQLLELDNVYEVAGVGTLFPDDEGTPILHMHMAGGRNDHAVTGCVRSGVKVWHILEVIITELLNSSATRRPDPVIGFQLLQP